ncbi:MAG: hypothetical protein NTV06_05145 [candidate division Zixibacteria bacterium]|nr:hypothetical protein [candidate division Zixibacteria bacterium]
MKKVIITLLALIFALAISAETTLAYPPPIIGEHPWGGEVYLPVTSPPVIGKHHVSMIGAIVRPLMSPPRIKREDPWTAIEVPTNRPLMSPPFIKGDHPWGGESYLPLTSPPRIKGQIPWTDIKR